MHELVYALRFRGRATPVGPDGNILEAMTTAASASFTTAVGPDGLTGSWQQDAGEAATFASEVTFTSDTSFQETGTITFGAGNILWFATVGQGYLASSVDLARKHGAVTWRVEGGEGQFAGASGLITSNFFVDDRLGVVDHHFGVLLVP
ncbi:MAG TPA: hypothetical protein VFQ80_01830 [Thermomicrobiales bacterium]|jgi:hypothetical protein|nr:hypothetical protein [Thermomicrobiales bacterium]